MEKIGKYVILEELGSGAMGIVYKAEDPVIGRTVAIKTIRADYLGAKSKQDDAVKRFIREAQSAGSLSHPNIITIHDINEDQGMMYIVMEYIEGQSLENLIGSDRSFSVDEVIAVMAPVADALDYAHKKGVIHRDIKPGNILVDALGKPHIVDFGIARISASTMTRTDTALGTPYYMAPEQIAGQKIDGRADIFSLGALIYEMLTEKKAFGGGNITTVIYKIIHENPLPVQTIREKLPMGLDHIINKALAKDPEERYSTCRKMIEELKHYPDFAQAQAPQPKDTSTSKTRVLKAVPTQRVPKAKAGPKVKPKHPSRTRKSFSGGALLGIRKFTKSLASKAASVENRKALLIVSGALIVITAALILLLVSGGGEKAASSVSGPEGQALKASDPLTQGKSLLSQKNYTGAAAEFEKILAKKPHHVEALIGLADTLRAQGKLNEARDRYESVLSQTENDARPFQALAEIEEKQGHLSSALKWDRKAHDILSQTPGNDLSGLNKKISRLENQLKTQARQTRLNTLVGQADKELRAKRYQSSLQKARSILKEFPGNRQANSIIGKSLEGMSRNQVFSIFASYKKSFGSKNVYAFLKNYCTPGVQKKMKSAIDSFYSYYKIYKNEYGTPALKLSSGPQGDYTKGILSFSQKSFARTQSGNQERMAVDGIYEWIIAKRSSRWIIENIRYQPNK